MNNNTNARTPLIRATVSCAAALLACAVANAWAQEKQKITYTVGAGDSKYVQRHMLEVGDAMGHTVGVFEIHRAFTGNAPAINGVKLKEVTTRGYSDYAGSNGLSTNYSTYVLENGDKFYTMARTMGQADATGRRTTSSVGEVIGGTGKLVTMKGLLRLTGVSDGAKGYNESKAEIEYWFAK